MMGCNWYKKRVLSLNSLKLFFFCFVFSSITSNTKKKKIDFVIRRKRGKSKGSGHSDRYLKDLFYLSEVIFEK